ncbi:MAG TPA: NUDIX hydrolase, partial [Acholeplasmataceae bacterium]|nr:NUDIX hydrolase [Acholeplasmataceae bacterium]
MILSEIEKYIPKDLEEKITKNIIIDFIKNNSNVLSRKNMIAHITTSAFI